jgi:hypothetical protein
VAAGHGLVLLRHLLFLCVYMEGVSGEVGGDQLTPLKDNNSVCTIALLASIWALWQVRQRPLLAPSPPPPSL